MLRAHTHICTHARARARARTLTHKTEALQLPVRRQTMQLLTDATKCGPLEWHRNTTIAARSHSRREPEEVLTRCYSSSSNSRRRWMTIVSSPHPRTCIVHLPVDGALGSVISLYALANMNWGNFSPRHGPRSRQQVAGGSAQGRRANANVNANL